MITQRPIQYICFASGNGSTFKHIHSTNSLKFNHALVISNKPDAKIVDFAQMNQIPVITFDKKRYSNIGDFYADCNEAISKTAQQSAHQTPLIHSLGYTGLIPKSIIDLGYPTLNSHPAPLVNEATAGKGMFGLKPY